MDNAYMYGKKKMNESLRKGPDLEKYLEGRKRRYTTYAAGARNYCVNYYTFVKMAKKAGANIQIRKKVIVDLDILEKYIKENSMIEGE